MKRLILTLSAFALAASTTFAQNISGASAADLQKNINDAKAKIAKSDADIQNPKSAAKIATWENRAKVFTDAASVNIKGVYAGMEAAKSQKNMFNNLEILVGSPTSKKAAQDGTEIWVYPTINFYVQNNQVQYWEETVTPDPAPLDKAVEAYRKACQLDAKGAVKSKKSTMDGIKTIKQIYTNNGINKYQLQKYNEAAADFEKALALSDFPKDPKDTASIDGMIAYYGGLSAFQAKNYAKARSLFNSSIQLNYEVGRCYHHLYLMKMEEGKKDEALKIIQDAYEKYPAEESLLYDVINYYTSEKEFDKAETYLNKAIEKYPNNLSVLGVKGSIYVEDYNKIKENYVKKRSEADSLKKLAFKNRMNQKENDRLTAASQAKLDEANALRKQYDTQMKKAENTYNQILQKDPKYFDAYFSLGIINYDKSDMAKIEADLIPFSEDKDGSKVAAKQNERKEACKASIAQFEKALAIQPTNKDVLTNLRMLHTQIGEYDKAKELKEKIEALSN
ncbi:MAG: tetratricopeptide repeat protein [Bacteroidales bacterium]|nr:tetratricopeptide repeat protein [Bacteroidales bacterium]